MSELVRHLSSTTIEKFTPVIPLRQLDQFETQMSGVLRWQHPKFQELNGTYTENDLQHVCEMLDIAHGIRSNSPQLRQEIDFATVEQMVVLHDMGEIGTKDISSSRGEYTEHERHMKDIEPNFASWILLSQIQDTPTRQQLRQVYRRYEHAKPNSIDQVVTDFHSGKPFDRESLFVNFLDKIQALRTIREHYHDLKKDVTSDQQAFLHEDRQNSLRARFLPPVVGLNLVLPAQARDEFCTFVDQELQAHAKHGFAKEVAQARSHLQDAMLQCKR